MNRDVLIDFADKKACGFDIIVIVVIYVRFVVCVRVFVCAFTGVESGALWRIKWKKYLIFYTAREDVVESFATRFAAARGGSGRRVCCQRCEEVFF
jgi:hypothetical protein